MELYIYDLAFTLLGIIDEIKALIWTRRYWDCGEFSLLVPMTDRHAALLKNGRMIVRKDRDEAGQIAYIHITKDSEGLEQIEVQGKFLAHWLGRRLLLSNIVMQAPTDEALRRIARETLVEPTDARRKAARLSIDETPLPDIETLCFAPDLYENALLVCSDRAKLAKLGFKITTDIREEKHTFRVYKGVNRTASQTENPICIFSPDFNNILSQEYIHSLENVATAIYVDGGAEQEVERMVVEVDDGQTTGVDRIEYLYSAEGLARSYTEDGVTYHIPDDEFRDLLQARGLQTLDQKTERFSFSSVIDTHANLRYLQDFDVGDRVTCLNRRWQIQIDARITEAVESYESGRESLEITFGVSIPTLGDFLRWR